MWECTDDIQGERKIRISKNGTLNIYIAVDISESIEKEHVASAKDAVLQLITKVRNVLNKNNAGDEAHPKVKRQEFNHARWKFYSFC